MPTLSVAVMAHPKRRVMVDELLEQLDRPAEVVWDRRNDRHDTGQRSLEAFDPSASHHLVIQDDAVPCRDLVAGLESALTHVPDGHPVSCYLGRVRPFARATAVAVERAGDSASWVTMDGLYWGPALVLPTVHLDEMLRFYRESRWRNYDRRVSKWYQAHRFRCFYTWPSLVDHRAGESLVLGHDGARHAYRFLGADSSALDVDWSGPVAELSRTERLDIERQRIAKAAAR